MRILVLGGTRFVGRAIVDALLCDHEVSVLNRATRPLWDRRLTQVVADRTDAGQMRQALGASSYDAVVDVSGTELVHVSNVIRALPQGESLRYVYISSAAVYNRLSADPPFAERDRADGDAVWDGYGEAKAACEALLRRALPSGTLTILRPPYVYGPHNAEQREQFLWARMISGRPILVPGDGGTRIQFIHARELARIAVTACEGRLVPDVYNVGEHATYSFLEYLRILARVAEVTPRLVMVTDTSIRPRDYFPFRDVELTLDVSRLAAAGVTAGSHLTEGLAETLAWFRRYGDLKHVPAREEARSGPAGASFTDGGSTRSPA
ncbi:NAD-dependent epimerase/dehydratase family protein [Nonomuraea sp. B5E05]|uniref:NAD-dependent epimerase/dehydratase family protein n=1 Tax=Nonomuraea sp. B5E05 TaxID=3153569 RepID=UPI00325FE337